MHLLLEYIGNLINFVLNLFIVLNSVCCAYPALLCPIKTNNTIKMSKYHKEFNISSSVKMRSYIYLFFLGKVLYLSL